MNEQWKARADECPFLPLSGREVAEMFGLLFAALGVVVVIAALGWGVRQLVDLLQ